MKRAIRPENLGKIQEFQESDIYAAKPCTKAKLVKSEGQIDCLDNYNEGKLDVEKFKSIIEKIDQSVRY